jgi:hypothetical protein
MYYTREHWDRYYGYSRPSYNYIAENQVNEAPANVVVDDRPKAEVINLADYRRKKELQRG